MDIPNTLLRGHRDGKFKPKLTEVERYQALACVIKGIKYDAVAATFGVDRRTVNHMANRYSKHYKDVRRKLEELGEQEFLDTYFDEKVLDRLKTATMLAKPEPEPTAERRPNARASGKKGIHIVHPEQCRYNHRLEIGYRADADPVGWWYRDLDGPDPDTWLNCGPDTMFTSQQCFAAAQLEIIDAMEVKSHDD